MSLTDSLNIIYTSDSELEGMIRSDDLDPDMEYLIRIHTCIHNIGSIMPFAKRISALFPKSKIIGSSTSGVIIDGRIRTDCCMLSFTQFQLARLKTCLLPLSDDKGKDIRGTITGQKAFDSVVSENSRFMLAFFARPYIKISSFVERLNQLADNMQMIGGIANTQAHPNVDVAMEAFVFNESSASNDSVAIAVIDAPDMNVTSDLIFVTEPVGSVHTITDADGMIIRAIDGENAVEWYQKQLGIDLTDKHDYDTTVLFPLVRSDYGEMPWAVSYSPQNESMCIFPGEPYPVMFVPSEAKTGERVRISYSSIQKTIERCEEVCNVMGNVPAEVLFGYSCVSRQDLFSNCAQWELMPFARTNLSGALVAGEIGNSGSMNRYCNYSFAISALSESPRCAKINVDCLRENAGALINDQEHIVKYLLNLNRGTSSGDDMSRRQHEIEETLFRDEDTGIGNVTKYSFDFSMGKFDKICMLTFRNEGLLNAFMSKSKFNVCLNRFYADITEFINDDCYSCYVYKKTCLIITCSQQICDGEFIDMMHSVQNYVSEYKFGEHLPVVEFSVVMHEEDMINKAELTLMSMRSKKLFFLHYTSDLGLEQIHARKLKMLKILNDAVANDRVIPYFQGIRDNGRECIDMYESLMRIQDDQGYIYTPDRFMDIAKEYGFYPDISYQMISKVMAMFRDRSESVTINLNISDIYNYEIVRFILKYLKNAPHPERYVFELTETEEIEDYQLIAEFVEQIHQTGGRIAIDDFGSGFSNIVNIFKIKSDFIKIDGEIVRNISKDIYAREFLEMIAGWAGKHDKEIIAEFIEDEEIQGIICENGIRYSQGYLFSKPSELV
ncbi:MAG: EAL domain-containing protein [Alistipes sp.]|nr:EAL domain-containing protein [Alistipes sp.]